MSKKLVKNSQPFGKNFQKTLGGIFFDSHCIFSIIQRQTTARCWLGRPPTSTFTVWPSCRLGGFTEYRDDALLWVLFVYTEWSPLPLRRPGTSTMSLYSIHCQYARQEVTTATRMVCEYAMHNDIAINSELKYVDDGCWVAGYDTIRQCTKLTAGSKKIKV